MFKGRRKDAEEMTLLLKLWDGKFGLVKSFWLFFFLVGSVNTIVISFLGLINQDTFLENLYLITFLYSLASAYSIISLVGVWRSANLFNGYKLWVILAKIIVALNFLWQIFFFSITFFMGIQYLLIHFCLLALVIGILNSRSGEKEEPKPITDSAITISEKSEDLLWTEIANEFNSSNRQSGLWAKCLVEASGDLAKAEFLYLKKRYEQLGENSAFKKHDAQEPAPQSFTLTKNSNINIDIIDLSDIYKITPIQKEPSLKYDSFSLPHLIKRGMFEIIKYKNRTLFHLHNGCYALIDANLIKVFDNESNIKKVVDSGTSNKKFPQGFIVSFEKDVFRNI